MRLSNILAHGILYSWLAHCGGVLAQTSEPAAGCPARAAPRVLEFRDALVVALDQQPQLTLARAEVEKARAGVTAALTPFLPAVTANFTDERFVPKNGGSPVTVVGNETVGGTQAYSGYAALGLTLNLFNSGKDAAGYRGARADQRASVATLASQLNDTVLGVIQSYGELADAQRSVLEQWRILTWLEDIRSRALERYEGGKGTTIEVEQANAKALETQRALFEACHTMTDKSAALAKAAGLRLPAGLLFGVGSKPPQMESGYAAPDVADLGATVEKDPAVLAGREGVASAEARLRQAKAAYGPSVSLIGRRDYLGQNPGSLGEANRQISPDSYRIDIQVQQPIAPFTTESATVATARAAVREAEAKYLQAQIDAEGKIEQALSTQEEAAASARAASEAVAAITRVMTLTESVHKAGRADLDAIDSARIDLERAQSLAERSSTDLNSANWIVYRALHQAEFPGEVATRVHLELDITQTHLR